MSDADHTATSGREALHAIAPEVARLMGRLAGTVPEFDARPMTAWARSATVSVTGLPPLPGALTPDASTAGALASELAEQVALDVASFDDNQRQRATDLLGRSAHTWFLTVYLADWIPRVRHALDAAFGPSDWTPDEAACDLTDLWPDFVALTEAIGALRNLDPVTSEVVRLRMARQHNCKLCKSLRNRTALEAGGTEDTYRDIDDWQHSSTFDERTRAALALADALVWNPQGAAATLTEVLTHFETPEVVELVADMLRNAANKVAVAAGTDAAHVTEGVEIYDVIESGETVFGLGHLV